MAILFRPSHVMITDFNESSHGLLSVGKVMTYSDIELTLVNNRYIAQFKLLSYLSTGAKKQRQPRASALS
jgi:hypothetical protein